MSCFLAVSVSEFDVNLKIWTVAQYISSKATAFEMVYNILLEKQFSWGSDKLLKIAALLVVIQSLELFSPPIYIWIM